MLYAPFGYKIMFTFDMPDGTKNGGLTSKPESIHWIWALYRDHNGTNLVIRDETIYKECDELREEAKTPVRSAEEEGTAV